MASLSADALVIGAGPAGSAAARTLALHGARVLLVDRHQFPRDKVCGDALIPDALAALTELGVLSEVLGLARRVSRVRVVSPDHTAVDLEGGCACLPRLALDDLLRKSAIRAGAEFRMGLRAEAAIDEHGVIAGARFMSAAGERLEIRAPLTVLSTGAAADVLARFGMCTRIGPSATAARIYVRVDRDYAATWDHLCIAYSQSICPGYGWLFPGPDDVFNVGVGYFYDAASLPAEKNVRKMLATFLADFPPARELIRHGTVIGPLKGAPLRTALAGATLARPGLLVAGEAAGLTYSFSGEGIGKALQSGIIAAQMAMQHRGARAVAEGYATALSREFASRFRAYSRLQRWLAYPAFVNFLARRGRSGRYVRTQLEGLLNETGDPEELLTLRGLFKAIVS